MPVEKNLLDAAYHYLIDTNGEYVTVIDAAHAPLPTPNASLASQRAAPATAGSALASKDRQILARSTGATVIARSTGHDAFGRGGTPAPSTPNASRSTGN